MRRLVEVGVQALGTLASGRRVVENQKRRPEASVPRLEVHSLLFPSAYQV
jgi:hypothetical protein